METARPPVLLVDDEDMIVELLEENLHDAGYTVVSVRSGAHAIEMMDAPDANYRALVTDINLGPGDVDGWHVAHHARELWPQIPVVYMSAAAAAEWAANGVPNSTLIQKPFAPAQVVTAISQLLNISTMPPTTDEI